jgi:hypothetical protein
VPAEDLGYEAAELLSLMPAGQARSLNKLAEVAVRQIPGCSAASTSVWHGKELLALAATHPDVAELDDLQLSTGRGPMIDAVKRCRSVSCADMLTERRWPRYAQEALYRGIRCSVCLVRELPALTLVMSMFGIRTGTLTADSEPMARMLAAFAQVVLSNTLEYEQAQRTAAQLEDSVTARAIVDQAKGILMHALSCDADRALEYLRKESQRRHVRVTEIATEMVTARQRADG